MCTISMTACYSLDICRVLPLLAVKELQRALEIERSERQSAESKTLRLLAEVREYHEKIVRLKEAKAK